MITALAGIISGRSALSTGELATVGDTAAADVVAAGVVVAAPGSGALFTAGSGTGRTGPAASGARLNPLGAGLEPQPVEKAAIAIHPSAKRFQCIAAPSVHTTRSIRILCKD